ncbi:MAG: translation initiation factor 2 [Gammaproteobacteria bacterium]|jgi:uncharacterized protein YoxC
MQSDSKRVWIQVIARLGRETQFHLDERYRHFKITDGVIVVVSLFMLVLAIFNVYYVWVLAQNLNGIVDNMDSMHRHMEIIKEDMITITDKVESFDASMQHMDRIAGNMGSLTTSMTSVSAAMSSIRDSMGVIDEDMKLMSSGMTNIDNRFMSMTRNVSIMRENTRKIARPMKLMP